MKKAVFIILSLLISTIVGLYLYRYHFSNSFDNKIPIGSKAAINIDFRKIEKEIFTELDFKQDSVSDKMKQNGMLLMQSIDLPSNIVFSTSDYSNWSSSKIKILNVDSLRSLLKNVNFIQTDSNLVYRQNSIQVSIHGAELILSYSNETIDTDKLFDVKYLTKESSLIKQLETSNPPLCYADEQNNTVNLSLDNNSIVISGMLGSLTDLFQTPIKLNKTDNSIAFFTANLNKKSSNYSKLMDSFENKVSFSNDSVYSTNINSWNGQVALSLNSFESKTDTFITYEYDDNFNRVEVKSTKEVILPNVKAHFGNINVDSNKLFQEMEEGMISSFSSLEEIDSKLLLKINVENLNAKSRKELLPGALKEIEFTVDKNNILEGRVLLK